MERKKKTHFVNGIEIEKLTQGLNSKKATGIDTILPELIKVAAISHLTFSWRRPISYRNQSIDLPSK